MKLVVGLGNPGRQYQGTRHNVGFRVLTVLAQRQARTTPKNKFHAETLEIEVEGEKVLLLSPLTYMNLSGVSVAEAKQFYQLELASLLIVSDDMNLPAGRLRFRARGSAGGQKGLDDVIRRLGSEDFPRLRIGIGRPPPGWESSAYVLGKFSKEEQPEMEIAVAKAADAVLDWVKKGVDHCMSAYNGGDAA